MTIVIEDIKNSRGPILSIRKGRIIKFILFAFIPIAILLFYGIEDNTAWFFGHQYIDDYRYVIDKNVYHIGIMVSHSALIVTVSIVGLLISWIVYEGLKASNVFIKLQRYHKKAVLANEGDREN